MIPPEQTAQIKKQLIKQIESTFPEDKKAIAKEQIEEMDEEQLEQFLIQNNLIQNPKTGEGQAQQCIFCAIAKGQAESFKLEENNEAVAVLEINPISKAHTIIIPKEHISDKKSIPKKAIELSKEIAKKIKKQFKPKDIQFYGTNLFGHEIINVLPIYEKETKDSPRQKASPEELKEIQEKLKKKEIIHKKPTIKKLNPKKENIRIPRRLP